MSAPDDTPKDNTKRKKLGIKPDATPEKQDAGKGKPFRAPVRGRHLSGEARTRSQSEVERQREEIRQQQAEKQARFERRAATLEADARATPRRRPRPEADAAPAASPDNRPRGGGRKAPLNAPFAARPDEADTRPAREGEYRPRRAELDTFFAPCAKGLEHELAAELMELGVEDARPAPGGVAFRGDMTLAWKANLWSRLAVRILWRIAEGRYRDETDLYEAAKRIDWPGLFHVERTLAVNTVARNSPLTSLNFVSLKIKDAVCDRFRQSHGERPSVDTRNPDVPLLLYLTDERFSLYVDLSGEPLNRRGFRIEPAAAPLNENLAAGLLRLSGWQPGIPFFDPMMGGGTLLIEAAMMWLRRAPGLNRHFAFEKLSNFDRLAWQRLRKDAEAEALAPEALPIFGGDIDPDMLRAASRNLKAAGLLDCVNLIEADVLEVEAPPTDPGMVISNPPYGVRLSLEDQAVFYKALGDRLKRNYPGWQAFFITADPELPKQIGLSASRRTPLFNGPLECRFYQFNIVAGSNRH